MFRSKKKANKVEVCEDSETEDSSCASEISEVKEKKSRFSKLLRCGILKKKKKISEKEAVESDDSNEYESPSADESVEQNAPGILRQTASVLTCGMLKKRKKTLQVESDDDTEDQSETLDESQEDIEERSQTAEDSDDAIEYRSQTDEIPDENASGKYKNTESLLRCDVVKKKKKKTQEDETDESGDGADIRRHSSVEPEEQNELGTLNDSECDVVKKKKKKKKKQKKSLEEESEEADDDDAIEYRSQTPDESAAENVSGIYENTESQLRCDIVKKKTSEEEVDESEDAAGIQSQTPEESEDTTGIQSETPVESQDAIGIQNKTSNESEDSVGIKSQSPEESDSKDAPAIYNDTKGLLRCNVLKKKQKKTIEEEVEESEYDNAMLEQVEYCDDNGEDNYESTESENSNELSLHQGEQGDQKKLKTKYFIGPGSAAGFAFVIRKTSEILSQKAKNDNKRSKFMRLFSRSSKKKKID